MDLQHNILGLKTSATLAINELSQKLIKEGKEVFKFGLGQSPFPVPDIIVKELQKNAHQKDYLNVSGLIELREEVANYHSNKNQYKYNAESVIIGPGSKELIFQTQLVLNCDLLLPSPSWVSYEPQAQIINKKVHWIKATAETNWHLDPEELDKTCANLNSVNKLLILNSPNNPSGTTHGNLKELANVAKKHNIIIIADEIYAELDFTGEYKSITHHYPEKTIVSNGLSKWCGAGGWRIGTLVFPDELSYIRDSVRTVASETFTAVSAPIQYAAIKAYSEDHSEYLENSRLILKMIGDYIYKELSSVGVICQKPQGGFYMICDFSNVVNKTHEINNDKTLCQKILNDIGFAMLPGSDFGMEEDKLLSRIAFVDFDGSKALKMISKEKLSSDNFLDLTCPKIAKGISLLKDWIISK
ncbi:aminotransferase class I/II-fold pyridoxal phosphate-dependent enzyme [Candidatus Thioglobus sp.]|nr:aminotransferase class I/II-fold pyridoxal phosphate-dependent enzyme [Candidatus Thioglobus sp.]